MARIITNIIIFSCVITFISSQCTRNRAQAFFKRSVYDFSTQLASRISQETEAHFIASGLSPWALISALSLGATEDTLTEIVYVLKMHPHRCFNSKYFEIVKNVTSLTNETILERSAAIFMDRRLNIKEDFLFDIRRAAVCDMAVLDFEESSSTVAFINDYVNDATHEAIDEIITPADLEGAEIIMIDALFFKGAWKIQFPYADTETSAFYNERGIQIGDVNLMFVTGTFNLASVMSIKADVLELPYGEQNRHSMLIFLPKQGVSVNHVIEKLNLISLKTIFALFNRYGATSVAVQIPRFKITSDINNLKELLIDMGLKKMFDASAAKFDQLADHAVHVSNIIQKADIEVTEDGTVASAVVAAVIESRSMVDQFVANKPFFFMIVDRKTEIPLFTGAYSKPNAF